VVAICDHLERGWSPWPLDTLKEMFLSPAPTSSFSRQGRPRPARPKVASGGLRGYTGSTFIEKRCGTREIALRGWETRWSAALAQSGTVEGAAKAPATNLNDIKISGLPLGDWLSWVISGKSPDYNPGAFNDGGSRNDGVTVQGNTNCYAYACNQQGPFSGQFGMNPGQSSGQPLRSYGDITAQGIGDRAVSDGLSKTFVAGCYPVSYVIAPNAGNGKPDYHWYRLDSNGSWSHKPGSTPATNMDYSGNRISDPATANRGPYTINGGILWVPSGFKF